MPYGIQKSGSSDKPFCVHKKMMDGSMGETVPGGCHETMEKAQAHMRALYANVSDAGKEYGQVEYYGGSVKALGNGKIAGYGVLFTTAVDPDVQGEFFTKQTDFELEVGDRRPIYYRHATHPKIQNRKLGKAILKQVDDAGAFFEGELNVRDDYERYIYKLAEMGKLGWSTGSAPHLVRKELATFGEAQAAEIKAWPIIEISLTPCPVEPRTSAFPVKSLEPGTEDELDSLIKSEEQTESEEPVSLDGLPALKALCEALSPAITLSKLEHSAIADAAVKELLTHNRIFVDAFKHYRVRLDQHVEFRRERNRKAMSDAQEETLKSWRDGFSTVRQNLESVETDLDGTLKLSESARAKADAAEKHAKFLVEQIASFTSVIAKE